MHKYLQALFIGAIATSLSLVIISSGERYATDKLELTRVPVHATIKPRTVERLQDLVSSTDKSLSVGGSCYSQGGQTAYPGGIVIDMGHISKIIKLDTKNKMITVQAGATWRKVQEAIDPHNLSVAVMQSYNDFSVGGSLSVNVHARDRNYGSLLSTVESFRLMLHDGSIVVVSKDSELFGAVIGGYGLLGIIIDVTLQLTDNVKLERSVKEITADRYPLHFNRLMRDDTVVFQNADLFPPSFDRAQSITWRTTGKPVTTKDRLQSATLSHIPQRAIEKIMQKVPSARKVRPLLASLKGFGKSVVWRNYEMSYSVNQLAIQSHYPTTMTLQEYFVPVARYRDALKALRKIFKEHSVNVLNLSVRYVPKDDDCVLSYAPEDCYAFVLYICIKNNKRGKQKLTRWTRLLIDELLALGGTYYLPYVMCATKEQFKQAYPGHEELRELKSKYDPDGRFRNSLWKTYFE